MTIRWALLAACLLAAGCGRGVATVSGTVRYAGKPLNYGTVVFSGEDGISHSGNIAPDGRYTVADVPAGPVRIAVVSPEPPGQLPPAARRGGDPVPGVDRAKWVRIPDKYGNVTTSGLTATVTAGPFSHDIDLR